MVDRQTTTLMLASVPFLILVGILSQIVAAWAWGPAHKFSFLYIGLMVLLLLTNIAALILHLKDKTRAGVLLAAWVGLACVSAMVGLDAAVDITDGMPWIVVTLYLAAYAISEAVGGRVSTLYSVACGIVLICAGIIQRRADDTLPLLGFLLMVMILARRSFYRSRQLEKHKAALGIVANGKRGRPTTGID